MTHVADDNASDPEARLKFEVLAAAGALLVGSIASAGVAHSAPTPTIFDFEAEAVTPHGSHTYTELVMVQGAVTVTLTRSSGAGFDVRNVSGFASSGWGLRTLSPFGNPNPADTFVADFSVPASEVSIEFGDFGPSDDDSPITLVAHAEPGATGAVVASATETWSSNSSFSSPKSLTVAGTGIRSVAFASGGSNPQTLNWDNLAVTPEVNTPPDCSAAAPSVSQLWPPNREMVPVEVVGISDADGDAVTVTVDAVMQDEPTDTGSRRHTPDGAGVGTSTAELRAERDGRGNGRTYHVGFTASDGNGGSCSGSVVVAVPAGKGVAAVDDGATFDSTG